MASDFVGTKQAFCQLEGPTLAILRSCKELHSQELYKLNGNATSLIPNSNDVNGILTIKQKHADTWGERERE